MKREIEGWIVLPQDVEKTVFDLEPRFIREGEYDAWLAIADDNRDRRRLAKKGWKPVKVKITMETVE